MTKGYRNRNNGTETKLDNFPFCVFKSDNISFLLKCTKAFEQFSESKLVSFMSMVNPNNGSETKSDAFLWDIFKSDTICFLSKNTKIFQWLSKSNISVFFITLEPNDGNETKSGIFSWDIFKSDIIFNWSQNYEIFKWLASTAYFNFIAKVNVSRSIKMKLNGTRANLTVFFLIYNALYCLNDFWNLFLHKVHLKNEWPPSFNLIP